MTGTAIPPPPDDEHFKKNVEELFKTSSSDESNTNKKNLQHYLKAEAERIAGNYSRNSVSQETRHSDRHTTIQHMYDTRRDFIDDANRYYTRYLVAIATILYSFKYSIDATDERSKTLLFLGTAFLCFLLAGYVWACKRLLQSVYYLYSASVVTATIKSLAMGDWTHAWFDSMQEAATKVPKSAKFYHHWGFGIGPPRPNRTSPREMLANQWASNPLSLLGINSIVHDVLFSALLGTTVLMICCAFSDAGMHEKQATQTGNSLTVLGSSDLDNRTSAIDNSVKRLSEKLDASQQAILAMSKQIEDIRLNADKLSLSQTVNADRYSDDLIKRTASIESSIKSFSEKLDASQQAIQSILKTMDGQILETETNDSAQPVRN
jgi:hypothetical protein